MSHETPMQFMGPVGNHMACCVGPHDIYVLTRMGAI